MGVGQRTKWGLERPHSVTALILTHYRTPGHGAKFTLIYPAMAPKAGGSSVRRGTTEKKIRQSACFSKRWWWKCSLFYCWHFWVTSNQRRTLLICSSTTAARRLILISCSQLWVRQKGPSLLAGLSWFFSRIPSMLQMLTRSINDGIPTPSLPPAEHIWRVYDLIKDNIILFLIR